MTTTIWIFLVDDADHVRRFPAGRWHRWWSNRTVLPELVGLTTARYISLGLQLENRKPVEVFCVYCGFVPLDGRGRIDESRASEKLRDAVNSMDARIRGAQAQATALPAPVLDARRTFGERMLKHVRAAFDAKQKWQPSDAVWAQVGEFV